MLAEDEEKIFIFIDWEQKPLGKPKLFGFSATNYSNSEKGFQLITVGEFIKSKN